MDKDKIKKWFKSNFHVHTDWTGDWVEYNDHCSSVDELITDFLNDMNDDKYRF